MKDWLIGLVTIVMAAAALFCVVWINGEARRTNAEYQQALIDCAHRGPNFNYVKLANGTYLCTETK